MENYRKYGSNPFCVVVIHGGPGAAGSVAPIARKLGETRGVLEPIQTAKTLDGQVEELRLIVQQNTAAPVVFIGHSWGAWLSAIVTANYPTLVRKLILVGSGPFAEKYVELIAENRFRRLSREEKEEFLHLVEMLNRAEAPDSNVSLMMSFNMRGSGPPGQGANAQVFIKTRRLIRSGCRVANPSPTGPPQSCRTSVILCTLRWSRRASRLARCCSSR